MRRFWISVVAGSAALAACRIEQTPESYIDNLATPASEIEASREELTRRLRSTTGALERRDRGALASALAPMVGVVVIGDEPDAELTTAAAIVDGLLALTRDAEVELEGPVVDVAQNNDVSWFRATYGLARGQDGESDLHFTGVFRRLEGDWRLAQGHLSRTVSPPEANPGEADTPPGGG